MLTADELDRIEKEVDAADDDYLCRTWKAEIRALVAHCRATVGAEMLPAELREIRERNEQFKKGWGKFARASYGPATLDDIDALLADAVAMRNMLADALEERGGFRQGFETCKRMALEAAEKWSLAETAAVDIADLSHEDALAELRREGR